ncbi:MAG: hypothetical protein LBC20_11825 [Planctomycetaceae bacterium]|jgi:hypothetical protein|nr:hypothetical protein [Planctomycetaceae bacterium]
MPNVDNFMVYTKMNHPDTEQIENFSVQDVRCRLPDKIPDIQVPCYETTV